MSADSEQKPVTAILGSGIFGLALGRMIPGSVIYEKSPHIGGASRTLHHNGFHFDVGLHTLAHYAPEVETFLKPFIGEEVVRIPNRKENYVILCRGRRWRGVLAPHDIPLRSHPFLKLGMTLSFCFRRLFPLKSGSFENYARNLHGDWHYWYFSRRRAVEYLESDPSKVPLSSLGLGSQERRSLFSRARNKFFRKSVKPSQSSEGAYPIPWFGRIVEKMAEGLDIRCSSEVTRIFRDGRRVSALEINHREIVPCENLISTAPPQALLRLFDPPRELLETVSTLRYRDFIFVILFFHATRLTEGLVSIASDDLTFSMAYEPKNWVAGMSPEEKTSIGFHIYCSKENALWRKSDDEIKQSVYQDFSKYYKAPEPYDGLVFRIPNLHLIWQPEIEKNLGQIREFVSCYENVYFPENGRNLQNSSVNRSVTEALRLSKIIRQKL